MRGKVFGVGVNDAEYVTQPTINGKTVVCPFYKRWVNMLERCYSAKLHEKRPTYIGCSVTNEWLTFSKFKFWMEGESWDGKHLDKDLLLLGNKVYGPELCVFIPRHLNNLLNKNESSRGDFPIGVNFDKKSGKFIAFCSVNGKEANLGKFFTPHDAALAYRKFKSDHVRRIAEDYVSDLKLYNGLIAHANNIETNKGEIT